MHVNTKFACSDVSSPAGELMFGSELPSDGESQFLIATEEVCRSEWKRDVVQFLLEFGEM